MSHLIDPCLRATKIAHGIRRGIDGISPLSGLVPELRILIQEQKNVLTSLKRTAFEKEEAAKHLAIYAKTEGPDIADTLSKLSMLVQKAADLERTYANSLAQSRELFKEIRVAEDENYSVRKRKLDLEQKLALDKTSSHHSTTSLVSTSGNGKAGSVHGPELHPEMKLLRQETMSKENELEDLKRKKIKKATIQQLDALEKLGKELVVVAYYGRQIMGQLDDSPTPAGTHADDRFVTYDGAAQTAYAVKAAMDTFKSWPVNEPQVQFSEIDLGDFPRDNKQAMDAMLKDLAVKSGSDWFTLQSPSSTKHHDRTNSMSSTGSGPASPRTSMSSVLTTTTYVDGVPMVKAINEIPPTPELEEGPQLQEAVESAPNSTTTTSTATTPAQEPIPIFVASGDTDAITSTATSENGASGRTTPDPSVIADAAIDPSPFVPHSTYKPSTTYQAGHGPDMPEGRMSPPSRSRPHSGEHQQHFSPGHAPHPLMMQQPQLPHQQQYPPQMYPPGPPGGLLPSQMPMPMPVQHMPMPMSMPVPHIPGESDYTSSSSSPDKRHSQPISVSFPMRPPPLNATSSAAENYGMTSPTSSSSSQPPHRRNPHAVLSPAEPGFRVPVGADSQRVKVPVEEEERRQENVYDGPPPDYAEAAMQPPAEKFDEKKKR